MKNKSVDKFEQPKMKNKPATMCKYSLQPPNPIHTSGKQFTRGKKQRAKISHAEVHKQNQTWKRIPHILMKRKNNSHFKRFSKPRFSFTFADRKMLRILASDESKITRKFDITCFTDGSKFNNKHTGLFSTGASAIFNIKTTQTPVATFQWKLSPQHSILQAEVIAIKEACSFLLNSSSCRNMAVAIFSDSHAAISSLTAKSSADQLIISSRSIMDRLAFNTRLTLFGIQGHSGIPTNEKADYLAKAAANNGIPLSIPQLPKQNFHPTKLILRPHILRTNSGEVRVLKQPAIFVKRQ